MSIMHTRICWARPLPHPPAAALGQSRHYAVWPSLDNNNPTTNTNIWRLAWASGQPDACRCTALPICATLFPSPSRCRHATSTPSPATFVPTTANLLPVAPNSSFLCCRNGRRVLPPPAGRHGPRQPPGGDGAAADGRRCRPRPCGRRFPPGLAPRHLDETFPPAPPRLPSPDTHFSMQAVNLNDLGKVCLRPRGFYHPCISHLSNLCPPCVHPPTCSTPRSTRQHRRCTSRCWPRPPETPSRPRCTSTPSSAWQPLRLRGSSLASPTWFVSHPSKPPLPHPPIPSRPLNPITFPSEKRLGAHAGRGRS